MLCLEEGHNVHPGWPCVVKCVKTTCLFSKVQEEVVSHRNREQRSGWIKLLFSNALEHVSWLLLWKDTSTEPMRPKKKKKVLKEVVCNMQETSRRSAHHCLLLWHCSIRVVNRKNTSVTFVKPGLYFWLMRRCILEKSICLNKLNPHSGWKQMKVGGWRNYINL